MPFFTQYYSVKWENYPVHDHYVSNPIRVDVKKIKRVFNLKTITFDQLKTSSIALEFDELIPDEILRMERRRFLKNMKYLLEKLKIPQLLISLILL